jgi:hypothetical protein
MMTNTPLRYLAAKDVENGADAFGVVVRSKDGSAIGRLEGFMMDPKSRTLRYFVVDSPRGRRLLRRLVPFVPAWLDLAGRSLHLLADSPSSGYVPAAVV